MKNNKVIKIDGVEYTFELDRDSIIKAEEVFGVSLMEVQSKLISRSYKLWVAGLDKNHNNISVKARMDLYDAYNQETGESMEIIKFLMDHISNFLNPTPIKKKK